MNDPLKTGGSGLLDELYREIILDHYRRPRNHDPLKTPTCSADVQIRGPVVSIFPGQTVCLSFELESGYLVPHATPEPYADSVVLRRHESAGGAEPRMAVFNPFALPIKYRAGMRVPDEPRYLATSSCSVIPGGVSSELWWHEIEEIVVANFHFLEDPEAMICN